jgi:hypothetical protein
MALGKTTRSMNMDEMSQPYIDSLSHAGEDDGPDEIIDDYHVTFGFDVTASSPEQAAHNALDDMLDAIEGRMPGCTVDVLNYATKKMTKVEVDDVV